jgi:hypothetical protein
MFWTVITIALLSWPLGLLFARTMSSKGFDDPIYEKNVQKLIERNRKLEEATE